MEEKKIESRNNYKSYIDKETEKYYYILNRKDIVKYKYKEYFIQEQTKKKFIVREEQEKYISMSGNNQLKKKRELCKSQT